jgi:hypothetical protein
VPTKWVLVFLLGVKFPVSLTLTLKDRSAVSSSGNSCYHSVQNLLSSSIVSKNLNIKIYKNIILPFVLYWCETWSLTLREERRLKVFENWLPRRIFWPRRDEVTGVEKTT